MTDSKRKIIEGYSVRFEIAEIPGHPSALYGISYSSADLGANPVFTQYRKTEQAVIDDAYELIYNMMKSEVVVEP